VALVLLDGLIISILCSPAVLTLLYFCHLPFPLEYLEYSLAIIGVLAMFVGWLVHKAQTKGDKFDANQKSTTE